jgi:hypothetical protein
MKSLLTVDIAHPPLDEAKTFAMLDEALHKIRNSKTLRVMKIIHGYGALGVPAEQKEIVEEWLADNRAKYISYIDGEELISTSSKVQVLLAECDLPETNDFKYPNGEITIVWVT